MKNLINVLVLLIMLPAVSCTKVIYTNEQVIGRYRTQQDVAKKFGAPLERKASDTTLQWLYAFETRHAINDKSVAQSPNIATISVDEFSQYEHSIIFSFDKRGNIVHCVSQGVDLTEKKVSVGKTIALGAAIAAVAVIVASAVAFSTWGGIDLSGSKL